MTDNPSRAPALMLPGNIGPTEGQEHLLDCIFGPEDPAIAAYLAWKNNTDLDAHVDWGTYRLLPLVYDRLRALGADDPFMGRLKGIYRLAFYDSQMLLRDAARIVLLLEDADIRTLMLKGAPLGLDYYNSPASRPMRDIDLAVRPEDAFRASEVLEARGWEPELPLIAGDLEFDHSRPFRSREGREMDLHWRSLEETPRDFFWQDARPFSMFGAQTLQPSPTAMLTHAVLHGMRSNPEPPVRWIADSITILRRKGAEIDWTRIVTFARQEKLTYRLGLGFRYLHDRFDAAIPAETLAALERVKPSVCERIENTQYLSRAGRFATSPQRKVWRHVAEHARILRVGDARTFWSRLPAYVCMRLRVERKRDAPRAFVRLVKRAMRDRREGIAPPNPISSGGVAL